jgi:spore coat polysaccharide biosynthesis protein SpsF
MKIVATIEARMTSSRLPGKVLLEAAGKPMLEHLVNRLRAVPSLDGIVLATTINKTDDQLEEFAKKIGLDCYRGSESDVLARVIGAGESAHADILVEITGDCPIIDHNLIEQTIQMFIHNNVQYATNSLIRSYPDGMDTQVIQFEALKSSAKLTQHPLDIEHVSRFICNHPELYTRVHLIAPPSLYWPELGLTLDEPKDYELLKKIIEYFHSSDPLFGCGDVIRLLKDKPDWVAINQAVVRKGDT